MLWKKQHVDSQTQRLQQAAHSHALFTCSGHIICLVQQCKLAVWLNGCMIWDPSLKSTEAEEWELMDLCFMTCFTGTLPLMVTLAHLWFMLQILIPFIQSWQPCIVHPCVSLLFLCLCLHLLVCLHPFRTFSSTCLSAAHSLMPRRNSVLSSELLMKGSLFFM